MRAKLSRILLCCLVLMTTAMPGLAQNYSSSDLDTLVGPIALYPDPLLSNVIRASTFPDQVVAASKTNTDDPSWDDSVKALDDYPDVVTMMASNLSWTKSLGWAATNQLADVMDAVQRYRYRAQQAGNLKTDSHVQVIQEGTTIRIESANPQVIYVPTYPPDDVDDSDFGEALVYSTAIAASAYMWTNMYHWNNNCWYTHPYGWAPAAGYYRPYGWQNGGVYTGNTVRLNGGNNVVRGPVTVNNVNVNANRYNHNGNTNVGNSYNRNTNISGNTRNTNISGNNRYNVGNGNTRYNASGNTRVNAEARMQVNRPNMPAQVPSSWSNPGLGSYSSSGATMRESNRGAYSRGSMSVGSGARMGGGGRRR